MASRLSKVSCPLDLIYLRPEHKWNAVKNTPQQLRNVIRSESSQSSGAVPSFHNSVHVIIATTHAPPPLQIHNFLGSIAPTSHALNTTLSKAALESKLAAAETTRLELEALLRKRDTMIEHLEADRRWPAQREQEEREERERLLKECKEEKLSRKN